MRRFLTFIFVLLAVTTSAFADDVSAKAAIDQFRTNVRTPDIPSATSCDGDVLIPPATILGNIGLSSCIDILGLREDIYKITVQAGQTIDVDFSSSAFEPYLYMYLGSGTSMPVNHGTGRETAHYTFTQSGTFLLEAESFYTQSSGLPWSGPYTLIVTLTGGNTSGACTPNSTTLCLNGNRFAVSVTWKNHDSPPKTGNGTAVAMSSDTGNFWFFQNTNTELVVKALDGRGLNGKFWIFFGSLTDVEFTLTVRDTVTGQIKTYVNQSGKMASVGDTSAF